MILGFSEWYDSLPGEALDVVIENAASSVLHVIINNPNNYSTKTQEKIVQNFGNLNTITIQNVSASYGWGNMSVYQLFSSLVQTIKHTNRVTPNIIIEAITNSDVRNLLDEYNAWRTNTLTAKLLAFQTAGEGAPNSSSARRLVYNDGDNAIGRKLRGFILPGYRDA